MLKYRLFALHRLAIGAAAAVCCLLATASMSRADLLFNVRLETAPLAVAASGPFSLDFQLTDGSGAGDGNNTVLLSNFVFEGGGGPSGGPALLGGATGSLASTITLTDSSFLSAFTQEFTPGGALRFDAQLTTNVDAGGTPDLFCFRILDNMGAEIPTGGPCESFVSVEINSSCPPIGTYGTDPTRAAIIIAPPTVTSTSACIPEPGSFALLTSAAFALLSGAVATRRAKGMIRLRFPAKGGVRGQC